MCEQHAAPAADNHDECSRRGQTVLTLFFWHRWDRLSRSRPWLQESLDGLEFLKIRDLDAGVSKESRVSCSRLTCRPRLRPKVFIYRVLFP